MVDDDRSHSLPPRLVLFDGVCAFCDRAVSWLLDRDPRGRLHFAPLQGEAADRLRARHAEIPDDIDTIVYVEVGDLGERVYLRSEAMFRVMAEISGPWRFVAWLRWVPRPIADWCYGVFARNRYRMFGKLDSCAVPSPAERARFVA